MAKSNFINNTANSRGGGVWCWSINFTLINCTFTGNTATYGGAFHCSGSNYNMSNCKFKSNTADFGGAVYWFGINSTSTDCTFTDNHAIEGDNVYWGWTIEEFLNKYDQINDYDYIYILNGVGTPNHTIVLNKKA